MPRRFSWLPVTTVITCCLAGAAPAVGQAIDHAERCMNTYGKHSADVQIASCSTLVGRKGVSFFGGEYFNRADAYSVKGEWDAAIADYTEAIRIFPSDDRYHKRGLAFFAKKNVERAIADYTEALKLRPYSSEALVSRAIAYEASQKKDAAIADYQTAIYHDPENPPARAALQRIWGVPPPVVKQRKENFTLVANLGHPGGIDSLAQTPDGTRLLSGGAEKIAKLWDLASGRLLRTFIGHTAGGFSRFHAGFLANGQRIATFDGKEVVLWDTKTGAVLRRQAAARISADVTRAISDNKNNLFTIWDILSGQTARTVQIPEESYAGVWDAEALSGDGRYALLKQASKYSVWDVVQRRKLSTLDGTPWGGSYLFSPDSKLIASYDQLSSSGGPIRLWNGVTGKVVVTLAGHTKLINSVAFSKDGKHVISTGDDGAIKLWDVTTGKELRVFKSTGGIAVLTNDGKQILSSGSKKISVWDLARGEVVRTVSGDAVGISSVAYSPDGKTALSAAWDNRVRLWDTATGHVTRSWKRPASHVAYSSIGERALSVSGNLIHVWNTSNWEILHTIVGKEKSSLWAIFSSDGERILSFDREALDIWETSTGRRLRSFPWKASWWKGQGAVAFSPDGTSILSVAEEGPPKLRNVETGAEIPLFKEAKEGSSVAFSPKGDRIAIVSEGKRIDLYDVSTGAQLRVLGHPYTIRTIAFSPDGSRILSGSYDAVIRLWDVTSGQMLRTFEGHAGIVGSVGFSPDGKRAISGSTDATIKMWNLETGVLFATFLSDESGDWLSMTPDGFFASSGKGSDILRVVRGFDLTTIPQVHQSLFSPDLVRDTLANDPYGEVRAAAAVVNLDKVLDSGPAPDVSITSPADKSRSVSDVVVVAARITDRGKGVGRIEWRVNGVTAATIRAPAKAGPRIEVSRELALDPGDNRIAVVAYNASDLLASQPAIVTVTHDAPADTKKPTLYVLAIGIDAYRSKLFSRLNFAAKDARALGEALTAAAAGLYDRVRVTHVIDDEATPARLDAVFEMLGREVHARDTFIFFASAHGYSQNGRFYLIPPDFPDSLDALKTHAISQERLQDWIANRIKARKGMLLLDTCESGAVVAGHTQSRFNQPASEAVIGRLHEAIGRPVLTAAASGKAAFEGYKNHGVFTWALLDALRNGDANGNRTIELSELASHVQNLVPRLGAELGGSARGFALVGPATAEPSTTAQAARFGSRGEDFVVTNRLH